MSGDRVPWPLAYLWAELYTFNPAHSPTAPRDNHFHGDLMDVFVSEFL